MLVGKKGNYLLIVEQDKDPLDPRKEWDNLGTMLCWHRGYNLGDKNTHSIEEVLEKLITENVPADIMGTIDMEHMEVKEMMELLRKHIVILPLYLYNRSGITISTSPFSCGWDSGMVGFIYADKKAIVKEYGEYTEQKIQLAREVLEDEVEIYDHYLQGEVYGFTLFENGEEIDSGGGFLGYCKEALKNIKENLPVECDGIADNMKYIWEQELDRYFKQKYYNRQNLIMEYINEMYA